MNLRKEGFIPRKGPSLFNFDESEEGKFSCRFMFREFEMTKETPEWTFS